MPTGFPLATRPHRAYLGRGSSVLRFQYNPEKWKDSTQITYNEIVSMGISYPILQFANGATRIITFNIFVNGSAGDGGPQVVYDARNVLNTFVPKVGGMFSSPPSLLFAFGSFVKECLLQQVDTDYTLFTPELEPLEATFSVTLAIVQS